MNEIGTKQCDDILNSFTWDSTGHPETNVVRKKERADSHIFFFRDWFNIMTARGLGAGRFYKIYDNTFGARGKFEEDGNVSLCDFDRHEYAEACSPKRPKVDRKLFLADYYVYKNSAQYFDIEGYKKLKTKQERIKFLNKYEDMGMILVPKDLVVYEKDEYGVLVPKGVIKEERLIAKEVKKCTNYGEEYNQTSLYDTIEDCLANGENLVVEPSK